MIWKYLLAALAGGLAAWLWQARRYVVLRLPRPARTLSTTGGEEFETLVEDLVTAAEQLMDDLDQRQREMQVLLQEADERIASLRQGQDTAGPAAVGSAPSEETIQAAAALVAAARLGQAAWSAGPQSVRAEAADPVPAASSGKPRAARTKSSSGKTTRSTKATGTRAKAKSTGGGTARSAAKKAAPRADAPTAAKTELRHQDVLNLAQRGLGPTEIARLTGRTTGEVQLILGLNRNLH